MRRIEIELLGANWAGVLTEQPTALLNEAVDADDDLCIYVWCSDVSPTKAGLLLEMLGNKTVKLTGRYRFRYDPPRTASGGTGAAPRGDFHLYQGDDEIAAWDDQGKARHGYKPGHKLPKKAYDTIVSRYPNVHGLNGRLLEMCRQALASGAVDVLVNLNEAKPYESDHS